MSSHQRSEFEPIGLQAIRPYLIVGEAQTAITFYQDVFGAEEVERHTTSGGGIGHAKLRFGDTLLELGEHTTAAGRDPEDLPRVGLRLYVTDLDGTYERAIESGATGDPPTDRLPGVRSATIRDPFGLTWWLAMPGPDTTP